LNCFALIVTDKLKRHAQISLLRRRRFHDFVVNYLNTDRSSTLWKLAWWIINLQKEWSASIGYKIYFGTFTG
jgi:hypothetical protein